MKMDDLEQILEEKCETPKSQGITREWDNRNSTAHSTHK